MRTQTEGIIAIAAAQGDNLARLELESGENTGYRLGANYGRHLTVP
jgi:hypothetical protein